MHPTMTLPAPDVIQRAQVMHSLIASGVTVDLIAPQCFRLIGQHGDRVLTADILHLRPLEISRLCGTP